MKKIMIGVFGLKGRILLTHKIKDELELFLLRLGALSANIFFLKNRRIFYLKQLDLQNRSIAF